MKNIKILQINSPNSSIKGELKNSTICIAKLSIPSLKFTKNSYMFYNSFLIADISRLIDLQSLIAKKTRLKLVNKIPGIKKIIKPSITLFPFYRQNKQYILSDRKVTIVHFFIKIRGKALSPAPFGECLILKVNFQILYY